MVMSDVVDDDEEDRLFGAPAIAKHCKQSLRQTYYQLEKGYLPAGKMGGLWIASKRKIDAEYDRLTSGTAE